MPPLKQRAMGSVLLLSFASPSHAFLTELVVGMTSVTNNLIDSTESVTNNTVNTASTTLLSLSSNPGKMADRIGLMADRIGFMADRIVTTEGIMAGLAHKVIDSNSQPRVVHQYASAYAPGGNPYLAAKPLPAVTQYGYAAQPDNSRYSASNMIYGVTGSTYTAAQPSYSSGYGFAAKPAVSTASNSCGYSYGVARSC